jgi:hypothetical protein
VRPGYGHPLRNFSVRHSRAGTRFAHIPQRTALVISFTLGSVSNRRQNRQQFLGKLCPNMARIKIEGIWYEVSRNNVSERLEGGFELN